MTEVSSTRLYLGNLARDGMQGFQYYSFDCPEKLY